MNIFKVFSFKVKRQEVDHTRHNNKKKGKVSMCNLIHTTKKGNQTELNEEKNGRKKVE